MNFVISIDILILNEKFHYVGRVKLVRIPAGAAVGVESADNPKGCRSNNRDGEHVTTTTPENKKKNCQRNSNLISPAVNFQHSFFFFFFA